jgi:hypothetical protein
MVVSTGPYKIRHIMQYTEIAYHAADGAEVERERLEDDTWFDSKSPEPLTEQEIDDWIPEDGRA